MHVLINNTKLEIMNLSNFTKAILLVSLSFFLSCENKKATTPDASTESQPQVDAPLGMVFIPDIIYTRGNEKDLGTRAKYPEEAPEHKVKVNAFFIDKTEVTNAQFKEFVEATGYITQAERGLSKVEFPNAPADQLLPGASVFYAPAEQPELWKENSAYQWWNFVAGANWKHPQGPQSTIQDKMDHPVTCVTNTDASAYAKWAGKRLPTEAEWEAAARGGLEGKFFTWGNDPMPEKGYMANTFQGTFPSNDTALDGHNNTSPVKSFPPNGYGLYDMAGNVWEHVSDLYHTNTFNAYKNSLADNPTGPTNPIDHLMLEELTRTGNIRSIIQPFHPLGHLYTSKGGSFLCHHTYCLRYRPAARHYSEGFNPTNHTGFRCAKSISQ